MKYRNYLIGLFLSLAVCSVSFAQAPKKLKHALPAALAVAEVPVAHPVKTAKLTLTGILRVVGAGARVVEGGVDIVHYGTTGLSKGAGLELKHNPFVYPDKVAAVADAGLEKAYLYLFHVQI